MPNEEAVHASERVTLELTSRLLKLGAHEALIVDSPPGAGKTTLVTRSTRTLVDSGVETVPVVVQTNEQANDLVKRISADFDLRVGRLVGSSYTVPPYLSRLPRVQIEKNPGDFHRPQVVVATASKWAFCQGRQSYPVAVIDEAYQMRSDLLYRVAPLFGSFLAVGDPGQLDPFTTLDEKPWQGQPYDPLQTAGAVLAENADGDPLRLPVSWRLPQAAARLVQEAFYDQAFMAGTLPTERRLHLDTVDIAGWADKTLTHAAETGWGFCQLPARHTPPGDPEVAASLAMLVRRFVERHPWTSNEASAGDRRLTADRIAVGTVQRAQEAAVRSALDQLAHEHEHLACLREVVVATANKLQGREFDVVFVWHPLSGRQDATEFHLEAGRSRVLLSRHRHACVVVSRAGIRELLDAHPNSNPVYLNVPAKFPDGWEAHQQVLEHLGGHRVDALP
ncbi:MULTISPECIES: AAA domain-containing protein [Streptomyces]|uniref:ATP-binding protein n=1 Tax=Streptomyces griseocarneus TaxID=51201 RepID=A0ABX7RM98_9ACTN|nr:MULTISPECIES: AAA domain-containing protein [Streptomyces]QSY49322.1 ATP-binding protein [Streptomyces griseocarneus]